VSDVLKIVEEALVESIHRMKMGGLVPCAEAHAALTALRGLEWRPIADYPKDVCCGVMIGKIESDGNWNQFFAAQLSKQKVIELGWTHFCRPLLPTPPKREAK